MSGEISIYCPMCKDELCRVNKKLLKDPEVNFVCGECNAVFAFRKHLTPFKREDGNNMAEMTPEERIAKLERKLEEAEQSIRNRDGLIRDLKIDIQETEKERDEAQSKLEKIKKWASMVEGIIESAFFNVGSAIDQASGVASNAFEEMP